MHMTKTEQHSHVFGETAPFSFDMPMNRVFCLQMYGVVLRISGNARFRARAGTGLHRGHPDHRPVAGYYHRSFWLFVQRQDPRADR